MLSRARRRAFQALQLLLLAMLAVGAPVAAGVRSLSVSQAVQLDESIPTIRAYLEAVDEDGELVSSVRAEQLAATLGEKALQLLDLHPFRAREEGVAYVFLIDISRSLSSREFDLILEALDVWVLSLKPSDRVAVIAFGDASHLVVDFTADRAAIKAGLYSLGPSDNQTVLHDALRAALELSKRRDPDLPGRRVLMVLTDGRDEGSGLTAEDVLELLRRDPVPIYAIGFSRIREPGARRTYLDLLRRFAANSGGAFFEGSTETLGTAYEAIRRAIHNVLVADFRCPTCRPDGEERRLQVHLQDEGRVLSSGRSVRLLPVSLPATVEETGEPAANAAPGPDAQPTEEGADTGRQSAADRGSGSSSWFWLFLLLLLVAAAVAWRILRRRTAPETQAASPPAIPALSRGPDTEVEILDIEAEEPETGPAGFQPTTDTFVTESGIETTRPPRPAIMRLVRLVVVRGEKPGRQYTLTLFQNAVIGSRSTCDCVLADPGVAPEQFELYQHDGRVYLRNLAGANPTLVDGGQVTENYPLESDTLVGNRDFIVRIVFEEARPVNT